MSDCVIRLGRCVTHNQPPSFDDATYCDAGFYAGFVDITPDKDRRAFAISTLGYMQSQLSMSLERVRGIKERTSDDVALEDALAQALDIAKRWTRETPKKRGNRR